MMSSSTVRNLNSTFNTSKMSWREYRPSAGLKLKPSKCKLIQRAVSYIGYHIGSDGVWPDEGKLHALSKWPEPTITEMRSFVGFCSYYRRFIKDFTGIAKPLHEFTKTHKRFFWNENCLRSFEDLRKKLIGQQF